jgi:hypothetical protein
MSEREINAEQATAETERAEGQEARGFEMPSCCGPMMERMMKIVVDPVGDQQEGRETSRLAGIPDCCKSMMAQMMKTRGDHPQREGNTSEKNEGQCCEPG